MKVSEQNIQKKTNNKLKRLSTLDINIESQSEIEEDNSSSKYRKIKRDIQQNRYKFINEINLEKRAKSPQYINDKIYFQIQKDKINNKSLSHFTYNTRSPQCFNQCSTKSNQSQKKYFSTYSQKYCQKHRGIHSISCNTNHNEVQKRQIKHDKLQKYLQDQRNKIGQTKCKLDRRKILEYAYQGYKKQDQQLQKSQNFVQAKIFADLKKPFHKFSNILSRSISPKIMTIEEAYQSTLKICKDTQLIIDNLHFFNQYKTLNMDPSSKQSSQTLCSNKKVQSPKIQRFCETQPINLIKQQNRKLKKLSLEIIT